MAFDWYAMHGARVVRTSYSPSLGRHSQLPDQQRLDIPTRVALEAGSLLDHELVAYRRKIGLLDTPRQPAAPHPQRPANS